MSQKRSNRRRNAQPVATEALETRTMLTANLTFSQVLTAQANDSGRIQNFINVGRLDATPGATLQASYDLAIAEAQAGRMGKAQKRFDKFAELAQRFVDNGKLAQKDANELINTGFFDRSGADFDILRQAVTDTGLTSLLNRPNAEFTVFAPTDKAFRNLAEGLGFEGGNSELGAYNFIVNTLDAATGDGMGALGTVLQSHVIRGQRVKQWLKRTDYNVGDRVQFRGRFFEANEEHTSANRFDASKWDKSNDDRGARQQSLSVADLVRTDSIETFGGETYELDGKTIPDAETVFEDAKISGRSDITVRNGVLHVVTNVIIPIDLVQAPTVTDIVATSGDGLDGNSADFDILLAALQATGLDETLDDASASVTVLAPNDAAFAKTAGDLGFAGGTEQETLDFLMATLTELGDGDPVPVLTDVLSYHVLPGEQSVDSLRNQGETETLLFGSTIDISGVTLGDADPEFDDASIVQRFSAWRKRTDYEVGDKVRFNGEFYEAAKDHNSGTNFKKANWTRREDITRKSDIGAENGVIHTIDRVMLPIDVDSSNTIADLLGSTTDTFDNDRSDFDILRTAVGAAGLDELLSDSEADLTVFAPTDNAFIQFARELGFTGFDEQGAFDTIFETLDDLSDGDPIALLSQVLQYHVLDGARTEASLRAAGEVTTAQGATLEVRPKRLVDNDADFTDGNISQRSDIVTENGIVHVITRVLLPIDL